MNRALLVIDVQNEYFTGALPITHPQDHFSQMLEVVDVARANKVPTVFVQHHENVLPIFRRGTDGWKLHRELDERPRDWLLEKNYLAASRILRSRNGWTPAKSTYHIGSAR